MEKFPKENMEGSKMESPFEHDRTPEQIEAKAKLEAVRSRVDILERHSILFVDCVEKGIYDRLVKPSDKISEEIKDKLINEIGLENSEWFLRSLGWQSEEDRKRMMIANAPGGEQYPHLGDISGVIVGGSPHMVSSENHPWMQELEEYIRLAAANGIPVLGVCFGHQIVAKSFGGKVEKTPKMEYGSVQVDLTEAGVRDALFRDLPVKGLDVQMSHSDVVGQLNESTMKSLAFNDHNLNQSIAVGENVRGVQFHPEIVRDILEAFAFIRREGLEKEGFDVDQVIKNLKNTERSQRVIRNFVTYFVTKYASKGK